MKLFSAIALLSLTLSTALFADHECLIKASNYDLLQEVSRRMGGTGPTSEKASVILACEYSRLKIFVTSASGKEGNAYLDGTSNGICQSVLTAAGSSFEIYQSRMIAICQYSRLQRAMLKADATVQTLSAIDYTNNAQCEAAAAEINKKN